MNNKLSNGVELPKMLLGTYSIFGEEAKMILRAAFEIGYRGIDAGRYYGNESDWGTAIKESGVRREEIFIQTKVSHVDEKLDGFDVEKDFEITLKNFSTDYIDCLLVHWPNISTLNKTWKSLERLYKAGKVRAIGVSNFRREHFELLKEDAEIMPMINQIERHPCRKQYETYDYCKANGIQLEAYQPLAVARPALMDNELLITIANNHKCTVPQVALAWNVSTGVIPLPRSKNKARLKENFDSLNIKLTENEIDLITNDHSHYYRALNEGKEFPGYWDVIHKVNIQNYC